MQYSAIDKKQHATNEVHDTNQQQQNRQQEQPSYIPSFEAGDFCHCVTGFLTLMQFYNEFNLLTMLKQLDLTCVLVHL